MQQPAPDTDNIEAELDLARYFPYRLAILDTAVSKAVSQLYSGRFNLSRQEWRILALLGSNKTLSAKEIASKGNLEKMQVSRAISSLKRADLVDQHEDPDDRRFSRLNLTEKGRNTYKQIVPLVLAREEFILSSLTEQEQEQLLTLMGRVYEKAMELQQWG